MGVFLNLVFRYFQPFRRYWT